MQEFKLPDLGEGMQEAEIVQWLVQVGDTVKLDQSLVKVETDKAIVEIPSPVAGRIDEIRVKDGQVAKVGEVLVLFNASTNGVGEKPVGTDLSRLQARRENVGTDLSRPQADLSPSKETGAAKRVLAAPAVRKLAFELGVDLEQVTPSNANGRVSIEDVRAYAERAKGSESSKGSLVGSNLAGASPATTLQPAVQEERQPLTGLRKRIAEHMERSWRTIPHATSFAEIDGSGLVTLRQSLKPVAEQRGVRLTYMPILVKLLILLLKEFPIFNSSLDEEKREIIYKRFYHIGVATDTPDGLLVPVLRDADRLTIIEIAQKLEHLIEGAHKRTLTVPEVAGSTFTLNNVGSFGGGTGTPIINHPEVAILAVGRLQEKAVVQNGAIIARTMMPLALSYDHRLIDGALSGRFLARFQELVENPAQLMLDMI